MGQEPWELQEGIHALLGPYFSNWGVDMCASQNPLEHERKKTSLPFKKDIYRYHFFFFIFFKRSFFIFFPFLRMLSRFFCRFSRSCLFQPIKARSSF